MEFRVTNASSGDEGNVNTVEVCIDDQWHKATAKITNNSSSPQNISIQENFTSIIVIWFPAEQSIPSEKKISGYSILCTTSLLSDHGQISIHEVRVPNISTSTTRVHVSGLLPGMAYQCCVNAHIQTNTPLDLISSNCITTSAIADTESEFSTTSTETEFMTTRNEFASNHHIHSVTGLGIGLGVACLLLMGSIVGFIVSKTMSCNNCLKHDSTIQGDTKRYNNNYYYYTIINPFIIIIVCTYKISHGSSVLYYSLFLLLYSVTEEYNLVPNPIYNISMQRTPQRGMITASTTVATTTRSIGDAAAIAYKEVPSNTRRNKPSIPITASQLATDV